MITLLPSLFLLVITIGLICGPIAPQCITDVDLRRTCDPQLPCNVAWTAAECSPGVVCHLEHTSR